MTQSELEPAVFLDRDGVLVEDVHLLTEPSQLRLLPGAAEAVRRLRAAGFPVVVVSNQPVIARGLVDEPAVEAVHRRLSELLRERGGDEPDACYYCPHHPNADRPEYRRDCDCRKPRPGLLLRAAAELGLARDARSYMIGDRVTDVLAGRAAGCTTILVRTGRHEEPPIESPEPIDASARADRECADLAEAAEWILGRTGSSS